MRVYLKLKAHFDAAHFLRDYEGKCSNLHGHRWYVEVEVSGHPSKNGILLDFGILKRELGNLLPDHLCLNDFSPFDTVNPTAENIATWLYEKIEGSLPVGIRLDSVRVWESENASALVRGEG